MKTGKRPRIKYVVSALVMVILILAAAVIWKWPEAVRAVLANWTVGKIQMDESEEWAGGQTFFKVPYASDSESQYLDLYIPDTAEGEAPPLYVIIHGGGFIANDSQSRQAQLMYRYFRDHGYACATINYRLAQEAPFPGAICDCKAAIRFLRVHAEEYGYDAGQIAVFGESAGGYLAVMCAVTGEEEFSDTEYLGAGQYGDVSAKVDVLVDYYGHLDNEGAEEDWEKLGIPMPVIRIANAWASEDMLQGYENCQSFWFRKNVSEMTAEEKEAANPYYYLEKNRPEDLRAWIIHGDCDITVPYLQSERFAAVLTDLLGADRVHYTLVHGMGHASDPLYSEELLKELGAFMAK